MIALAHCTHTIQHRDAKRRNKIPIRGATGATGPALRDVQTSGPEDPVQGASGLARAARTPVPETNGGPAPAPQAEAQEEQTNTPVVKSEWDKTGRNEPCPCGSGKKYKLCHGK